MIDLLHIDCMEYMATQPDKAFDLAIVDPPYGIGATWSKSRRDRFYKAGKLHSYQNEEPPGREYFEELMRVSENQIVWGGNYFTEYLPPTNSWVVWDKNIHDGSSVMSECELAWTSYRSVMRMARFVWNGAVKCERVDKIHPHQKPVKLYDWLLREYAAPGQRILDTHFGSGSSAIAAHYFGVDFVGCEIDEVYLKATLGRFHDQTRQKLLFKQQT